MSRIFEEFSDVFEPHFSSIFHDLFAPNPKPEAMNVTIEADMPTPSQGLKFGPSLQQAV
jgi:hypothetical protein